jgi:hypothetical protein
MPFTIRNQQLTAAQLPAAPEIADGRYTIVYKPEYRDTYGPHITFKISTGKKGSWEGKRIVSLLTGPDNENDYRGFAFLLTSAQDGKPYVACWRRFKADHGKPKSMWEHRADHISALIQRSDKLEQAGISYALQSGNCRRCGRTLTRPDSNARGYGPECYSQLGGN